MVFHINISYFVEDKPKLLICVWLIVPDIGDCNLAKNSLRKNQNSFRRNWSKKSQILTICRIIEGIRATNLEVTLLFADFSKVFYSVHRGKTEQIFLAYGLPKETVAAIIMRHKNTKVKVCSTVGNTEFFDIIAGVLRRDTLPLYLFIICLYNVLQTLIDILKENGFILAKAKSRRYSVQTITDADYTDDIALLANTPAKAEFQLHSLQKAAGGIGHRVNWNQTEYMCFNQNQKRNISTLKGGSLKLVDKFTYLGRSVSSTKNEEGMDRYR